MEFRTGNLQLMKDWNLSLLANLIRRNPRISRAELTAITSLSPTTVSSLVAELIEDGLVRETGVGESTAGRKPILLEFIPEGRIALGISINHDGIRVAPVNLLGKPLYVYKTNGNLANERSIISQVDRGIEACIDFLKKHNLFKHLFGFGIGVLGLVEGTKSRYLLGDNWHTLDLAPLLTKYKGQLKFEIENDINAMALGETWFGQGKEDNHVLYVYTGYGLGIGLIIDGNLYRGAFGNAGELGHVSISQGDHGDLKCSCGLTGCLGPIADGAHLMLKIKEAIENNVSTSMSLDNLNFESFLEAAVNKDPLCEKLLDELIFNLSRAIISTINLLDPGLVILGGFFSNPNHLASERLIGLIKNNSIASYRDEFKVFTSNFGDDSGVIGAATLILKNVFDFQITNRYID
ncbi:MAG: ROK family transcriptional regulator [Firmicutes bacterium]|nr:ROK family transcriptional regulator [Bacillota bacterium]MDD4693515.1 ROK family transcriptional regulator [Bacillota bacterium]